MQHAAWRRLPGARCARCKWPRFARPRVPVNCCKTETSVVKMSHPLFQKGMFIITYLYTNLYIEHGHKRFQR